jgi:FtsP/CotA-like multicopper oxidase with cupredoxin domain
VTNVDTIVPGGPVLEDRVTDDVWAINGHSWPHTERFSYTVGDSVRWRILNVSNDVHPFHLHGFYFRVESRGDGLHDTRAFPAAGHLMVTYLLSVGDTSTFLWVPERPGNWLFHCHFTPHFQPSRTLRPMIDPSGDHRTLAHGEQGMGGLVIGVHVRPGVAVANVAQAGVRRRLRLLARVDAGGTADEPAYGFVLHERGPEPPERAGLLPAPTIVLTRGEPVSIWVVNQLPEPTGVHWHGIELESYYDGVPGFSGEPGRLAPAIAPADSFEVRFTPPRAGTFIYHTHVDEARQQPAGLTGALVVVEAGQPHHSDTDRTYLITTPRSREAAQQSVLLNGKTEADPVQLRAGVTYRMRFVNITFARPGARVILSDDAGPVQWRVSAKDGADLPASRITDEPADRRISIGETFDAEYTPTQSGELRLEVWTNNLRTRLAYAPVKVR